jgi:D-alanine-D-alanine ligase
MSLAAGPGRAVVITGFIAGDAPADELETLEQVEAVRLCLEGRGWLVEHRMLEGQGNGLTRELRRSLPDLVFNLADTVEGTGALAWRVPELMDRLAVACTGNGAAALRTSTDKRVCKGVLQAAGIATPASLEPGNAGERGPFAPRAAPGHWIVKPACEDGSVGIDAHSVFDDLAAARAAAVAHERRTGSPWLVEEFIDGREFAVSMLETGGRCRTLPPAEMRFEGFPDGRPRILDYESKWATDSLAYATTVRSFSFTAADAPLIRRLVEIAEACWKALGLAGYARIDLRVDGQGKPWVIDVNANPSLAPDAGFAAAAAQAGIDYEELVSRIAEAALLRRPRLPADWVR